MKRVTRILYLVGAIFSFSFAGASLIIGFVFALLGALRVFTPDASTSPAQAEAANLTFLIVGIVFLVYTVPAVLGGIFAFRCRDELLLKEKRKGIHIATLVCGAITFEPFLVVPAIFSFRIYAERKTEGETAD